MATVVCPKCRQKAESLFGLIIKKIALKSLELKKRTPASKVLCCGNKKCRNYDWTKGKFYCPKCKSWNIINDYWANEGAGFTCKKCRFEFAIIN